MKTIIWDDKFDTGIAAIDRQHRALFEAINRLNEAFQEGRGKDIVGPMLDFLSKYAETHFKDEEALMRKIRYPAYLDHKERHQALAAHIREIKNRLGSGEISIPMEVSILIAEYLREHIKEQDFPFASYARIHGTDV